MNTPKHMKITSKYLSPCRTFGLKRKSTTKTPVGLKLLHNRGVDQSPSFKPNNENNEPESHLQTPPIVIQHQASSPVFKKKTIKTLKKLDCPSDEEHERGNPLENIENIIVKENPIRENHVGNVQGADANLFRGFVSKKDLEELIKTVNVKIAEVNKLKRTQIYSKKHNLNELHQSTQKWKEACKEIVWALHEEMKLKGQEVPLDVILREHGIPYDVIGFNEEIMDFDS